MLRFAGLCLLLGLAACSTATSPVVQSPRQGTVQAAADRAARNFVTVVERVAPVAEQECRRRAPTTNCNYMILIDDRLDEPSNAFQTVDQTGRPMIIFTLALIAEVRNQDELAFVLGHEAAHHILGHLTQTAQNAQLGALVLGNLAAASGYSGAVVESAAALGAEVGARQFSKAFELEADALGAVITRRAGYDPVVGAAFFARIPDPGDEFLGTHPPNAERQATVQRVVAGQIP